VADHAPALIVVGHGSSEPVAATAVEALAARLRAGRAGRDVTVGYLEHARPRLPEVLAATYARGHRRAVVVPLLLTAAYHSTVDLPGQLAAGRPRGLAVRQAQVLGPDPALVTAVERRLRGAGVTSAGPRWGLVLAAAGSRDPSALRQVAAAAAGLRRRGWATVITGYAATAAPRVPEAVATLRGSGVARVAVATYLLTPGRFHESLRSAGADAVSDPLADTSEVADLVWRRYDAVTTRVRLPGSNTGA
jgi:sirohydrochlorin ferrochelatase